MQASKSNGKSRKSKLTESKQKLPKLKNKIPKKIHLPLFLAPSPLLLFSFEPKSPQLTKQRKTSGTTRRTLNCKTRKFHKQFHVWVSWTSRNKRNPPSTYSHLESIWNSLFGWRLWVPNALKFLSVGFPRVQESIRKQAKNLSAALEILTNKPSIWTHRNLQLLLSPPEKQNNREPITKQFKWTTLTATSFAKYITTHHLW